MDADLFIFVKMEMGKLQKFTNMIFKFTMIALCALTLLCLSWTATMFYGINFSSGYSWSETATALLLELGQKPHLITVIPPVFRQI